MSKAKKFILIALLCLTATVCAAVGISFAYFSNSEPDTGSFTIETKISDGSFISQVGDFGGLYTASKVEFYNDKNIVSEYSTTTTDDDGKTKTTTTAYRKIIKLTQNITLTNDLLITADVHIDLNGKTLNLNGYTLTVQHAYAGTFLIYNGTVTSYTTKTATASSTEVRDNGVTITIKDSGTTVTITNATSETEIAATVSGLGANDITGSVTTSTKDSVTTYTITYTYNKTDYTLTTAVTKTETETTASDGTTNTTKTYTATDTTITTETYCPANIVVDTRNAVVINKATITTERNNSTANTAITVSNTEKADTTLQYLAYSALYTVGEGLSSSIEKRPARLTYPEFTEADGNNSAITADLFIAQKSCHSDNPCVYVAVGNDLMLPTYYLSTDYGIEYKVGDGTIFSALGNALKEGNTTLTVTIYDGETNLASVTFNVHVVAAGDSTAAQVLLESYLSDHYNSSNDTYEFAGGFELPAKDEDLGITYSYNLYSEYDEDTKEGTSTTTYIATKATINDGTTSTTASSTEVSDDGATITINDITSGATITVSGTSATVSGLGENNITGSVTTSTTESVTTYTVTYTNGNTDYTLTTTVTKTTTTTGEGDEQTTTTTYAATDATINDGTTSTTASSTEVSSDGATITITDTVSGAIITVNVSSKTVSVSGAEVSGVSVTQTTDSSDSNKTNYTITYTYNSTTYTVTTSVTKKTTVEEKESEGVWELVPTTACKYLVVTVGSTDTTNTTTTTFALNISSAYVTDTEAVAQIIMNKFYGGSIIYNTSKETRLYDLSDIETSGGEFYDDLNSYITNYGVTNISCDLSGNVAEYYTISTNKAGESILTLSGEGTPSSRLGSVLYTIEFSDGTKENISLDVVYTSGGDSSNPFLPYYNSYDAVVVSSNSSSFTLPFAYNNETAPYTAYEFTYNVEGTTTNYKTESGTDSNGDSFDYYDITNKVLPAAITLMLVHSVTTDSDGKITSYEEYTNATFTYSTSTTSLVTAFDTWLDSSNYSLTSLASAGAQWLVKIDPTKMLYADCEVLILYNYKFAETETSWTAYQQEYNKTNYYTESTVTKFTLAGGVFYSETSTESNAVNDFNLFIWMSDTFDGTSFTTSSTLSGDDLFIERGALAQTNTMDVTTDKFLKSVTVSNWKGIRYLTGLTEVNLSGITGLTYATLTNFQAVQKLTLQNCKLTAESFYTTDDGGETPTYLNLPKLKVLDVRTNNINTFEWLTKTNFPKLEKAHITGNEQSGGYTGNTGMSNYWIFEDLTREGVTVYNTTNANGIEIPFAESTELNDYRRLKSLVYQAILPKGVSIKKAYKEFENLPLSYFNLEGSYDDTITWGYGGGEGVTDATYFTLTLTVEGTTTTLTVKFYVDRWSS